MFLLMKRKGVIHALKRLIQMEDDGGGLKELNSPLSLTDEELADQLEVSKIIVVTERGRRDG